MSATRLRPGLIILPDGVADWETPLIAAAVPEFCGVAVRHATPGSPDRTRHADQPQAIADTGVPETTLSQLVGMVTAEHSR